MFGAVQSAQLNAVNAEVHRTCPATHDLPYVKSPDMASKCRYLHNASMLESLSIGCRLQDKGFSNKVDEYLTSVKTRVTIHANHGMT